MAAVDWAGIFDEDDPNFVAIPSEEYEALTALESHVNRLAARRDTPGRHIFLGLLARIRSAREG